jgi:sigma-B regulation protein RsbU (phosphoserine phosphatase)
MKTLLVAAEDVLRGALAAALRSRGYTIARCDAAAALDFFAADPHDLVIVDLAAHGPGAAEVCRRLRALPAGAGCVVLAVAAGRRPSDLQAALDAGADDYLLSQDGRELLDLRLAVAERQVEHKAACRRAMDELVRTDSRFRRLMETMPDAILQIDADGAIRLVNEQAEKLSRYRRDELLGRPVEVLVPERYREAHVGRRRAFFEQSAARPMGSGLDLVLRRKDGTELPVDICLGQLREGDRPYVLAALRDVTERRRMQEELRLAKEAAERAYQRVRQDVEAAAHVQRALLPAALPAAEGVKFAWQYRPCAELAGDGLNVFWLDEDHVGLYVLDVSGHGAAAALLSVSLARLLSPTCGESMLLRAPRAQKPCRRFSPPAEAARRLNDWFLANPTAGQFFTIIYGILNVRTRRFSYASAGHPGPLLVRGADVLVCRPPAGPPIGILGKSEYKSTMIPLRPGDRLFLYSDGLTEALNPDGRQFGLDRLRQSVLRHGDEGLDAAARRVVEEVLAWSAGRPPDDLSLAALAIE